MKRLLFTLIVASFASLCAYAQGGDTKDVAVKIPHKVDDIVMIDFDGKEVSMPFYGKKHMLIFYVDPDKARQNEAFTYELEENHAAAGDNIEGFGIINLKDSWYPLPNSVVRAIAKKRTEKNGALIISDPDRRLAKAWGLGDCNNKFVLMIVSREGELVFCRKGEFTEQDKADFYEIVKKYR